MALNKSKKPIQEQVRDSEKKLSGKKKICLILCLIFLNRSVKEKLLKPKKLKRQKLITRKLKTINKVQFIAPKINNKNYKIFNLVNLSQIWKICNNF